MTHELLQVNLQSVYFFLVAIPSSLKRCLRTKNVVQVKIALIRSEWKNVWCFNGWNDFLIKSKNDLKFCHLWSSYIEYMLSGQNGVKSRKREEGEEYFIGRGHRQIPSHTEIFILIEFFTSRRKVEEEGEFLDFLMNDFKYDWVLTFWLRPMEKTYLTLHLFKDALKSDFLLPIFLATLIWT